MVTCVYIYVRVCAYMYKYVYTHIEKCQSRVGDWKMASLSFILSHKLKCPLLVLYNYGGLVHSIYHWNDKCHGDCLIVAESV